MRNIWLIGMMGSGKTSVGRGVAKKLQLTFVDSDDAVADTSGRSIDDLFSDGEHVFRGIEHDVIVALAASFDQVVATGGGAVLDSDNVAAMRDSGTTVLLDADPQTLRARLEGSTGRPLLRGGADIAAIVRERAPAYAMSADITIDTTTRSVEDVVDEVVACVPM